MENNSNCWLNLFGNDVRQRLDNTNQIVIYQPQPCTLITPNGFSLIHPDYFQEALITPILEKKITEITIPLNKIIAINAIENPYQENFNPETIFWDKDDQVIVNKIRDSIRQKEFDFADTRGIYAFQLPGDYYVLTGGLHRVIAMLLEGISQANINVNQIKDKDEFKLVNPKNEYIIQQALDNGRLIGKIIEDEEFGHKIIIDRPKINNPLQLFKGTVSDELINVLSQTLS